MNNVKTSKAIKMCAFTIMSACLLFLLGSLVMMFAGFGMPESWQHYDVFYVLDPFSAALLVGVFAISLLIFIFSGSIARRDSK